MIRHSSSFFISIVVHLVLLFGAYFAWSSYLNTKEEYLEESVCFQLQNFKHEQEEIQEIVAAVQKKIPAEPKKEQKRIEQPKKPIEPKIEKKIEESSKPKPEPKPIKKEIAVEKAMPKAKEVQKSEVVQEVKTEEEKVLEVEQKKVQNSAPRTPKKVETKSKKKMAEPKSEQSRQVDATENYLKINTQKISELIRENLYYPMTARKRNITGRVSVRFTICSDAKVNNIEVIDSSSGILSRAALKSIEELSGKFPKPKQEIILSLPIDYNLR